MPLFKTIPLTETILSSSDRQQAVILSYECEGINNENSIFAYPVFLSMEERKEYISPFTATIYRAIHPWNREGDPFEILSQRLNNMIEGISPGDILVSFLLTEESVSLSDESLSEKLSTITESYVFSEYRDSIHYRLIAINEEPDTRFKDFMRWHYFVQVWDDNYIWAQPLYEGIDYKFDQAVFVTAPDGNELILLSGRTDRPSGSSFAVAGTGYEFKEGIWFPVKWDEIYDEVVKPENLDIASDGIRMLYTDPFMAKSYLIPPHEGGLYELKLTTDGSFWADYSKFPNYPANENLPSEELLFELKQ